MILKGLVRQTNRCGLGSKDLRVPRQQPGRRRWNKGSGSREKSCYSLGFFSLSEAYFTGSDSSELAVNGQHLAKSSAYVCKSDRATAMPS
jgi:hypothetical protein